MVRTKTTPRKLEKSTRLMRATAPYQCTCCGEHYVHRQSLRRHMKNVHWPNRHQEATAAVLRSLFGTAAPAAKLQCRSRLHGSRLLRRCWLQRQRRLRLLYRWAEQRCRFRLVQLLWWRWLPRRLQGAIQFRAWAPATRTGMAILPCNVAPACGMTGSRFQRQNCTSWQWT